MANARIGVYPGTFDPITLGHVDVIRRALALVDKLVIGVAVNAGKGPLFSLDRRIELVREEMTPLARANGTELEVAAGACYCLQCCCRHFLSLGPEYERHALRSFEFILRDLSVQLVISVAWLTVASWPNAPVLVWGHAIGSKRCLIRVEQDEGDVNAGPGFGKPAPDIDRVLEVSLRPDKQLAIDISILQLLATCELAGQFDGHGLAPLVDVNGGRRPP